MSAETILIIAGLVALGGLIYQFNTIREIFNIHRIKTHWISALPSEGMVEVMGHADKTVAQNPTAHTDCVLWQIELQEYKRNSKGGGSWSTAGKGSSTEWFEMTDDTGKIMVNPTGADIVLADSGTGDNCSDDEEETNLAAAYLGVDTSGFLGGRKQLRVIQRLVMPHEDIYVLGEVTREDGTTSLVKGTQPMVISDKSEKSLLNSLYWRVALWTLLPLVVGGIVAFLVSRGLLF
jgi:hypothetical protein